MKETLNHFIHTVTKGNHDIISHIKIQNFIVRKIE